MPSPHSRIGLVVDDSMESALGVFRRAANNGDDATSAGLVRRAVVEGTLVEGLLASAGRSSDSQERAGRLVAELREIIPTLALPTALQNDLVVLLEQALDEAGSQERRRRQLEVLESPNLHGRSALNWTDTFDAIESTEN